MITVLKINNEIILKGAAIAASPVGLAAYILEKFSTWTNNENKYRPDGALLEKFTLDELLDNIMVYWVTNSLTTSVRLYAENFSKTYFAMGIDKLVYFLFRNSLRLLSDGINKHSLSLSLSLSLKTIPVWNQR